MRVQGGRRQQLHQRAAALDELFGLLVHEFELIGSRGREPRAPALTPDGCGGRAARLTGGHRAPIPAQFSVPRPLD